MTNEALPHRLRDFIVRHLSSVEDLEILLLVWRDPRRWWTAPEIARELEMTEAVARRRLERLSGPFLDVSLIGGLSYRFAPGHDGRGALVADLAAAYEKSRTEVAGLILSGRSAR
jgi:hypothetical protein